MSLVILLSSCGLLSAANTKTLLDLASAHAKNSAISMTNYLTTHKFKFLNNKPMSREQAVALIGNGWSESKWKANSIQNDFADNLTNDQALKLKDVSGAALGFYQWDISNRRELVQYAISKKKNWNDLALQEEFTGYYIDNVENGLVGKKLAYQGFNKPGQSVEYYTTIAFYAFEGQLKKTPVQEERITMANLFLPYYNNIKSPKNTVNSHNKE